MFSYSPFHTHIFNRQPCVQCEGTSDTEFLKFTDLVDFFFISHPTSGQKEGKEHERIMYFYPDNELADKKINITGFAEAVVGFTSDFIKTNSFPTTSTANNYRYVNSTNSREIILIVENGLFLIGASLSRKLCKEKDYFPHLETIKVLLSKTYETFRLFYGPFLHLFLVGAYEFKQYLNRFFTPYLQMLQVNKIPLMDLFSGVDFMPLNSVDYLEVECLVTRCLEEFPQAKYAMFLYQNRLIHYSVEKTDLIAVYQFLAQNLIPYSLQSELQPEIARKSSRGSKYTGTFITGLIDFLGELSQSAFPTVYLSSQEDFKRDQLNTYLPFELIAYRALNATICLFFPQNNDTSSEDFLDKLADFLDPQMCILASKIGEIVGDLPRVVQSDIPFHFVYYNPDSLSLRTSFSSSMSLSPSSSYILPPSSIYKLVYEVYDHFTAESNNFAQIYVKAENDWWIVFKKVNGRVLLLLVPQTVPSTVVDIYECTDSIIKAHFDHIFIT